MFPHISWLIGGVNTSGIETLNQEQLEKAPTFLLQFYEALRKIDEPLRAIQFLIENLENSNPNCNK